MGADILEISLEILTGNKLVTAIAIKVTGVVHIEFYFLNYSVITQSNP